MYSSRLILFAALLVASCSAPPPASAPNNPGYDAATEERISRIINGLQVGTPVNGKFRTATLADQMKKYHTPGVSIAVINNGKIEWARGFGVRNGKNDPVDTETLFEAGSVSKPTFALAVMKLKEKGNVNLDQDVNTYLKSWKIPALDGWQPQISLRQLLSHTAGLTIHGFPGYKKSESVPTVPQLLSGQEPSNTDAVLVNAMPGTMFRYSGGGTTVAQLAISEQLNLPFPALMRQELFGPLGLRHSTYQQPLPDSLESIATTAYPTKGEPIEGRFHTYPEMAAAGLWTNPSELCQLAIEVQKAMHGESTFFKKETIEEMLTPQKVASNIGIGYFLEGKGDSARFRHGGWDEGFVTEFFAYTHLGKGAVIMINSNEGADIIQEIMNAIAKEYEWPDFLTPENKNADWLASDFKDLPGTYTNETYEMTITRKDSSLTLSYMNQPPVVLRKMSDGLIQGSSMNFTISRTKEGIQFGQMGRQLQLKRK